MQPVFETEDWLFFVLRQFVITVFTVFRRMKFFYFCRPMAVFIVLFVGFSGSASAQTNAEVFWENLKKHCGKAYEGKMPEGASVHDFAGKKLIMQIRSCEDGRIRVPFFVGENRSRTWVFTMRNGLITLKHDHRHEDGTQDKVTQYGGTATNTGFPHQQIFPADQQTAELIDYASGNVWWVTINEKEFSYNLRRIGSDRLVSVIFDLTKEIPAPSAPWGWSDL